MPRGSLEVAGHIAGNMLFVALDLVGKVALAGGDHVDSDLVALVPGGARSAHVVALVDSRTERDSFSLGAGLHIVFVAGREGRSRYREERGQKC